uniref:Variant surface glycoprotein MITat 1.13 n=1 Tax=Trypanosoma brucei TaxID=5691 RepID=Q58NS4_9TRYP|nr:variant surface glycoprotein MITat 1.13 [Trypanosoma brucei]6Z8G_A Chain A, Variant surface glycoprotein MITat 1.13 [Trypanosoma brucei]6Z8G_B Chain B, Variant surface glycoprotein MITat 1.13 [Trypanosoma brucei]6Z8H_A Chain A, Variant surface glycoprotein MITat 1.13 [Trypanosoma brucei]6Z8H_B Chain B, Variant surface glycoprotein MITat 1.13 [Trypanosoma brucei]
MQRLGTAVFFLLAFRYSTEQAVGLKEPNAPCTTACGCKSRLLKRLDLYTSKYADGINNERENSEAYSKLVTAALAAVPTMQRKILPLLGAAADILDICRRELATARPLVQAAISKIEEAAGVYNTLHKLERGLGEAKIEFGGTDLRLTKTKFRATSLGTIHTADCPNADPGETNVKIGLEHEENEPEPAKLITHGHLDATCASGVGQSSSCHTTAVEANTHLTLGLTFSGSSKDESATWNAATNNKRAIHSNDADFLGSNATVAHEALKAIRSAGASTPCSSLITDFNAVRANPKFKLMVIKALLNKPTAEKESDAPADEVNNAINSAYGREGSEYNTKTWKDIGSTRIPKADPPGEKTDTIDKLSSLPQWGDAIARLLLQEITKQEEQSIKTSSDEATNKECDKHTAKTEGECTKLGCDYDAENKKCKPKSEKETTAAGKKDRAAGETGCAKHGTDKDKCENDKSCKWENNACKDSSILATKKFALSMVSAAFVTLLF